MTASPKVASVVVCSPTLTPPRAQLVPLLAVKPGRVVA